ncbi:4-coumarate--CoA ligase-like 7 isoform X1 [Zingiber officinale]|uniref:4-coumarate--CoA ligase-like 7 isoform X1 n=1 Tax=Zingiber officinale TaxID=94328 RepID=UPI001C4B64BC|nr:4-coumarate--CoA ligase-like 7 isoform X1 [Zingiber officinale]
MEKRNAAHPIPTPPSLSPRSSGFHAPSRTFQSLRPPVPLPPVERRLNVAAYAFSLLPSPLPSNPALVDAATGDAVSFPELLSQIRSLASALRSHAGIDRGHCVFVLAPTSLDIPPLYLALLSIGAVVSAANPASTPREISHFLSLSNPRVAFATSATDAKLPAGLATIILDSPRFRSFLDGSDGGEAVEEVAQSDVAFFQFSSGTTGMMKAAALSHRNMIAIVAAWHSTRNPVAERRRGAPEATLLAAPLFHAMGYAFLLIGLALGETTVLIGGRTSVKEMVQAAERHRVTSLTAATPVVVEMARWPEPLDLVALEYVICGGAPVPEAAAVRFMRRFPHVELRQGYGSTEAGPISGMIGQEECRRLRSVGRLGQNVEAMLVDTTTGERLSVGQSGELWLRSPYIMLGYVGNEEANDATFDSSGWLKTGDLCYFDEDGFLFIVDRLKELIKCGASQVPPAELEHLLQLLPGIADSAVVPYPDEEAGQVPMAFVVLQPGINLNEEEIMDFIAKQVIPYKKIRKVVFIDSIPKTPTGKIARAELHNHSVFSSMSKT